MSSINSADANTIMEIREELAEAYNELAEAYNELADARASRDGAWETLAAIRKGARELTQALIPPTEEDDATLTAAADASRQAGLDDPDKAVEERDKARHWARTAMKERDSYREKCKGWEGRYVSAETELHATLRRQTTLELERDEARKELDQANAARRGLREQCDGLRHEVSRITTRNQALAGERDATQRARDALRETLDKAIESSAKMLDQCHIYSHERDELRAAIKICRPKIVELSAEIHELATQHLYRAEGTDESA